MYLIFCLLGCHRSVSGGREGQDSDGLRDNDPEESQRLVPEKEVLGSPQGQRNLAEELSPEAGHKELEKSRSCVFVMILSIGSS